MPVASPGMKPPPGLGGGVMEEGVAAAQGGPGDTTQAIVDLLRRKAPGVVEAAGKLMDYGTKAMSMLDPWGLGIPAGVLEFPGKAAQMAAAKALRAGERTGKVIEFISPERKALIESLKVDSSGRFPGEGRFPGTPDLSEAIRDQLEGYGPPSRGGYLRAKFAENPASHLTVLDGKPPAPPSALVDAAKAYGHRPEVSPETLAGYAVQDAEAFGKTNPKFENVNQAYQAMTDVGSHGDDLLEGAAREAMKAFKGDPKKAVGSSLKQFIEDVHLRRAIKLAEEGDY